MMCCNVGGPRIGGSFPQRKTVRRNKKCDRKMGRRPLRKSRGGLPEEHDVARAVLFGGVERGSIRRVSKGRGGVRHVPGKTVGGLSLSETDPSLSFAPPRPRDRGHYGRRIRLDRSHLQSPKHYGKRERGLPTG